MLCRNQFIIFGIVGVLGISSLTMFGMGVSGQKYARIEFCFRPDKTLIKNKKSITKFCNEDKRHVVPESTWNAAKFEPSNPYYQSETAFIIPKKASRLKVIPANNPNYGWYLVGALGCSVLAAGTCQQRINTYKSDFTEYLAKTKKSLKENVLSTESDLKVYGHTVAEKEATAKDSISRQYQSFRDAEKSEGEVYTEELNAKLNNELVTAQHQLNLAQLQKETVENLRDKTKAEKEINKLLGTKNSDKENDSNSPNKQLINDLIEALKNHEDGWLWTVVDAIKPIWLVGDMGTGKTNTSVAIGLIRKYCLDIPIFRIADRHLNGENSEVWNLLEAQLKADNDGSILEAIQDVIERREDRINSKVEDPEQFLLDEFTQLASLDKESVERFVSSTFSDTRKAKEYFIGVTHNLTNAAFGDGTASMRKGAFYLKKFTLDNKKPLPRIVVKTGLKDDQGNNLEDVEKTLPSWFRAETIYRHFNGQPINFED